MSNRGIINPILLIVAALLVVGGVTAWAAGAFESADASATTENTENKSPNNAPSANNMVADPAGAGTCPVTGKGGGMMDVALGSESDGCSGCPSEASAAATAVLDKASGCSGCPSEAAGAATAMADKAAGCSGCADKSDCSGCEDKSAGDGCADKGDCDGCETKGACEDCPDAGCEDCPEKSGKDCCGTCGGKQ